MLRYIALHSLTALSYLEDKKKKKDHTNHPITFVTIAEATSETTVTTKQYPGTLPTSLTFQ